VIVRYLQLLPTSGMTGRHGPYAIGDVQNLLFAQGNLAREYLRADGCEVGSSFRTTSRKTFDLSIDPPSDRICTARARVSNVIQIAHKQSVVATTQRRSTTTLPFCSQLHYGLGAVPGFHLFCHAPCVRYSTCGCNERRCYAGLLVEWNRSFRLSPCVAVSTLGMYACATSVPLMSTRNVSNADVPHGQCPATQLAYTTGLRLEFCR
jgi:hypothetical protein